MVKTLAVPRILVADHLTADLAKSRALPSGGGYQAIPLPSGSLALRAARESSPDLILLDSDMPGLDGLEACRLLTTDPQFSGVPVVLVGTDATVLGRAKAFDCGAIDYLVRPFPPAEIEACIETQLRLRREVAEGRLAGRLLAGTLDVLTDGIVHLDAEGVVGSANRAFMEQWQPAGSVVGRSYRDVFGERLCGDGEPWPGGWADRLAQLAAGPVAGEVERLREDGTTKVFATRLSLLAARNGEGPRVVVCLRDITASRDEEPDSAARSSLLRAALETTTDGVLVADTAGRPVFHNQPFLDMWQLDPRIVGEANERMLIEAVLPKLVSPDEAGPRLDRLCQHLGAEDQLRFALRDGRLVDCWAKPQRSDARLTGRVWRFRDVTEHVQRSEDIRLQNGRLQSLQRIMSDPGADESDILQDTIKESCRLLDMERTYIGRIEGRTRTVEYAFPVAGQPAAGDRHDLSEICCGLAIEAAGPLLLHDLSGSEYRDTPCCRSGIRAYAGIPVRTSRGEYGVLSFTGTTPRPAAFSDQDRDFLVIVSGLVGEMLERLERKRRLVEYNRELEEFNQAMVDREIRVIELKEEVNRLAREVGRPPPYEEVWRGPSTATGERDE